MSMTGLKRGVTKMSSNKDITPELQDRIDLGKKGKLWRIEILYKRGNEVCRIEKRDRTGAEVKTICEDLYIAGLTVPISPGHFRVVSPYDILEVDCYKQDKFIGEDYY